MASEAATEQQHGYHLAGDQRVAGEQGVTNGHHKVDEEQGRVAPGVLPPVTVSQVPQPTFMKLANPGPLGLISFALTTFVLGLYQCGAG